jgi:hypothetical protein
MLDSDGATAIMDAAPLFNEKLELKCRNRDRQFAQCDRTSSR